MIAGHFGFAAAVKSRAPSVPLWALMLACQWMDVAFIPLFVAGVERMVPANPAAPPGAYGNAIIYADDTHSLLGAVALSIIFGIAFGLPWGRRAGLILGGMVLSHWVLDLITHRQDLPLLPGNYGSFPRMGFGLWQWPAATAALEAAIVLAGAWLYWSAARKVAATGGGSERRANVAGALVLAFGLLTLGLNVAGM
ncbi:MAG TPA: hypothetical protein VFB81_06660 [Myxococcales bacterium]|nr:hypothetical protein [Myxococcales bacterium]